MNRTPGEFRIVEALQKLDQDIRRDQLRYHRRRVLVSKEFTFDAAHHLHAYDGKCKNLHGHTYKVVFGISGRPDEIGMTVDFGTIKEIWKNFQGRAQELELPRAPKQFLQYFEEPNRPQAKLDRDLEGGMAVTLGRLRPDTQYDYKFVGLSHNTLRGAAGGAVLLAELLCAEGYILPR